jgi:hypothetical protein
MFWKKREKRISDEKAERMAAELLGALGADDVTGALPDSASSFAALQKRIAAEAGRPSAVPGLWDTLFSAPRLTVPVMAALALVSVAGFAWSTVNRPPIPDEAAELKPPPILEVKAPVSACALSNKPECTLTTGDVLATMMTVAPKEKRR